MTAINYGRSTELKFVFVGPKVLLISAMINEQYESYVLWKEEKTNVQEVKSYIENLKKVEEIKKEYNFKQVFNNILADKKYKQNDVEIISITPVSQEEYIFIIYHIIYKIRFRFRGFYSVKNKKVTIEEAEEVFSTKLQEIKEPEAPQTRVIAKQSLSKSVEAKEVFDYLYKIQPSFRQNLVQNIKVEETDSIKKLFIISKKEGKDYRMVILKDKDSQELELIDEGFIVAHKPTATIVTENKDGTTTVTTNKIDKSQTSVKTVVETLKKSSINIDSSKIESLQTTEGPKSIEYVAVLVDSHGTPSKQVTITQDKVTKETTIIDYTTIDSKANVIKPVEQPSVTIPVSDYYKPEVKELISKVETKVEKEVTITKVNKIDVTETTNAKKYDFVVETNKGTQTQISVIQVNGETGVQVVKVQPYVQIGSETFKKQTKVVKKVDEFGVQVEFTNDVHEISTNQNTNAAITAIKIENPDLSGYEVVSSQTKKYVQQQQEILIMTNGTRTVQVTGFVDQKTLRYVKVEEREVPVQVTFPIITQNTIPVDIYPVTVKNNVVLKESETTLLQKFKIFKNKIPTLTTIESLEKQEIITFNYEINQKKFVAVVQYDKTKQEEIKVL